MSDIDILHEMIKDTAKLLSADNKKQVTLTESGGSTYSVTINGMPDKFIVIKADAFRSPDTVFKGSHGEYKRADFVIMADTGKKKIILCIEMKATKDSEKEIIQQLTGAQCFVKYCREIGKAFWNQQKFLDGYEFRFVSIGHISVPKQQTRYTRKNKVHNRPDWLLKIFSPHCLEFNHRAGENPCFDKKIV